MTPPLTIPTKERRLNMDGPERKKNWLARQRETQLGRFVLLHYLSMLVVVAAGAAKMLLLLPRPSISVWTHPGMLPFAFIPVWATILILIFRVKRRAKARDYEMCKHCGYDLRQTPEPGPCPECGREFSLDELTKYWMSQ